MNRRQAREETLKILFQLDLNKQEPVLTDQQIDDNYIQNVVEGVRAHQVELDETISSYLKNWTLDRIAIVDKTILRMAAFEIIYMESIPQAVSINEAVELAHLYGDEHSSKFINGVLSKINK
jgi:N utilization substance protein B